MTGLFQKLSHTASKTQPYDTLDMDQIKEECLDLLTQECCIYSKLMQNEKEITKKNLLILILFLSCETITLYSVGKLSLSFPNNYLL